MDGRRLPVAQTIIEGAQIRVADTDRLKKREQKLSRLYLQLASECLNKAEISEHADATEALRRMGRGYIAQASILDPSRSDPPSEQI
jgi:hypothetical protein